MAKKKTKKKATVKKTGPGFIFLLVYGAILFAAGYLAGVHYPNILQNRQNKATSIEEETAMEQQQLEEKQLRKLLRQKSKEEDHS